jgi:type VI secretion system protein ImpG
VDDPFVARLLEGIAFLAARVQHRLDDELPEISDALLEMLSPHLLAPVPSMTTLRLAPPADTRAPVKVPRGLAVETEPVRGEPVRFRTCHDVTLWPLTVDAARLSGLPLTAPANPRAAGAVACLRLTLKTASPDLPMAELGLGRLRLHLRGIGPAAAQLHELLCTATLSIALADGPADARPTILGAGALQPGGFEAEEAALPWPRRAFAGYRLLTEFFAFPEKFLYLDLDGLDARSLVQKGDRLEVFIYLSRSMPELERTLTAENLALSCTPAVNLFPQRCEPIALDGTQSEWLVVPDARRPTALESMPWSRCGRAAPTAPAASSCPSTGSAAPMPRARPPRRTTSPAAARRRPRSAARRRCSACVMPPSTRIARPMAC